MGLGLDASRPRLQEREDRDQAQRAAVAVGGGASGCCRGTRRGAGECGPETQVLNYFEADPLNDLQMKDGKLMAGASTYEVGLDSLEMGTDAYPHV